MIKEKHSYQYTCDQLRQIGCQGACKALDWFVSNLIFVNVKLHFSHLINGIAYIE